MESERLIILFYYTLTTTLLLGYKSSFSLYLEMNPQPLSPTAKPHCSDPLISCDTSSGKVAYCSLTSAGMNNFSFNTSSLQNHSISSSCPRQSYVLKFQNSVLPKDRSAWGEGRSQTGILAPTSPLFLSATSVVWNPQLINSTSTVGQLLVRVNFGPMLWFRHCAFT